MLGSSTLDMALGLVFVYLILSLIVSAVQELIDTVLKLRASHLSKGIEKLLGKDKAKEFFDNVLISALSPNRWFASGTRRPSYIPAAAFSATVLDMLAKANVATSRTLEAVQDGITQLPDGDLKRSLISLLEQGEHKLEAFEGAMQGWFNNHMDRVSGWYKRKVQLITLGMGLLLSIGIDADSLAIVKSLSNDSALRSSMVAQAQAFATQRPTKPGEQQGSGSESELAAELEARVKTLTNQFGQAGGLGLPIGFERWMKAEEPVKKVRQSMVGWLLTACAVSLGAPFWFDILSKVVSVRASGKTPDERATAGK